MRGARAGRKRADRRGLITLEWLLIVGAVAGLAAVSVAVVTRAVEGTSDAPPDPMVRVIEAKVAAAFVEGEAVAAFVEAERNLAIYDDGPFELRCTELADAFEDVIPLGADPPNWKTPFDGLLGDPSCPLVFRPELFESR